MPVLEPRGNRSPKVKVDLDPPGKGSYSTLIVTMGLSSTVNPQYTPRQTDGHAPDNSPTYALMHCIACICIGGLKIEGGLYDDTTFAALVVPISLSSQTSLLQVPGSNPPRVKIFALNTLIV